MQTNGYTIVIRILIIIFYHFYGFIKIFGKYYKETKAMMQNNF